MSVNGVTGASSVYGSSYSTAQTNGADTKTEAASESKASASAVYESASKSKAAGQTYKPDASLIAKMKADAEARTSQLQSIVEKMLSKQANTYGKANDIWSVLSSGNFTADPITKAQAQADIAEDGYWGVKQTSQRILDFATALTGGDPSKIDKMRAAFEKGYEKAQRMWGGSLPDISRQTYDAVLKGFDQMKTDAGIE